MVVTVCPKVKLNKRQKVTLLFEGESSCLVKAGDIVEPESVIIEGRSSRVLQTIHLARELGVKPVEVAKYVLKSDGEIISKGDVIAKRTVAMGTIERIVKSLVSGRVSFSHLDGGVIHIRAPFSDVRFEAGVHGRIVRVLPSREGIREVALESLAYVAKSFIQVGGSVSGKIYVLKSGASLYRAADVDARCADKIVVAGRSLSVPLYEALVSAGAKGVIVGGMPLTEYRVFREFPIPVAITEGWGVIPINAVLLQILTESLGNTGFIDVDQRCIAVCPVERVVMGENDGRASDLPVFLDSLQENHLVQVWDMPYWGFSGRVRDILEDEDLVSVEFGSGKTVTIRSASIVVIGQE